MLFVKCFKSTKWFCVLIVLLILEIATAQHALAQMTRGTTFIKGSELGISSTRVNYESGYSKYIKNVSTFNLATGLSFFVLNNLSLGIDLHYSHQTSIIDRDDEYYSSLSYFSFGTSALYYILGKVFIGAGYMHSFNFEDDFPIELGGTIFLNDYIALEPAIKQYRIFSGEDDSYLSIGFSLSIYLNRNKE